ALGVAEELGRLLLGLRRPPLQALARLHVLAAADLVTDSDALGRPRPEPGTAERLDTLVRLVGGATTVAAPVLVAVVHGELLAVAAFGTADGVVARAAARLTALASGLDPKGLAVPEVGHLRRTGEYRAAAAAFASGTPDGLTRWLLHCCWAWQLGAREAESIAAAA
ncbi:MAG: oxidoreductase, partial [Pseudonocardia sp.]